MSVGFGWQIYAQVLGLADSNADSLPDLAAFEPNGKVWFYAGDGMSDEGYKASVADGQL